MMKIIFWIVILTVILTSNLTGCGAKPAVQTTLVELTSNPAQYSGKTITVDGIYVRGWEWLLLADSVAYVGTGSSRELRPAGESIWFAGLMPKEVQDGLYQYRSPSGDTSYFGKLRVTGVFETEGKYGHLNQFKYRITASRVELLEWTPPE